jgi:methylmalonyl-CoA mutase N-terminal domain/subunit
LRKERDNAVVQKSLDALRRAASDEENVMPYLVDCCKSYATVGEMAGVFRDVFGEHVEANIF